MNDSFLKEIGRSYIVSSFLPSIFFVSIGYFLFQGLIPLGVVRQIIASGDMSKYQWVVIFILVMWVAFYLYSANDVTVRLFEGYFIPKNFYEKKEDKKKQVLWEKKNLPRYTEWKKKQHAASVNDEQLTEEKIKSHFVLFIKALVEIANVDIKKPLNISSQMPTRLGNVLRSSETYAFERYFIIDTAIWPRLLPVLPSEMTKHLEEKNNLFMFLLNSSFLAYILFLVSALSGVLGLLIDFPEKYFYIGYEFISAWSYVGLSLIFLIFGYILYLVAVNAAEDFSMYIRTSFDLYRIDLLRQLNWEPPKKLEDERKLWLELSKHLIAGSLFQPKFASFKRKFSPEKTMPQNGAKAKDS